MSRVLLIRPLCEGDEPELAEPLGIERLAGYLRIHGVTDVRVFDHRLYQRERRLGASVRSFWSDVREAFGDAAPDVVGLSLMTSADVPDALRIISRARALWPHARYVAGGLYVTTSMDEARVRLPSVVGLLAGEGERALLEVVTGRSSASSEPLAPDEWAPAFRPDVVRYAALGCAVNLQTSRGCPGRCAFCATPGLPAGLGRWQPRDLSLVVDEMAHEAAHLEAAGLPPVFNFVDDDFGPLSRVETLAALLERRCLRVAFALEMRLASLIGQPDLSLRLKRLHRAGLTRIFVGVESLDSRTLRRWHKPYDVRALPDVLASLAEAGISVQAGYILWHADQTVEGALAEVRELRRLGIYSHRVALSRLIVFAGCELYGDNCDGWGFQRMGPEEEERYQRLLGASEGLASAWTAAAIAEPYEAAVAFLTGDDERLRRLHQELTEVNERSYQLFEQVMS